MLGQRLEADLESSTEHSSLKLGRCSSMVLCLLCQLWAPVAAAATAADSGLPSAGSTATASYLPPCGRKTEMSRSRKESGARNIMQLMD